MLELMYPCGVLAGNEPSNTERSYESAPAWVKIHHVENMFDRNDEVSSVDKGLRVWKNGNGTRFTGPSVRIKVILPGMRKNKSWWYFDRNHGSGILVITSITHSVHG